MSARPNCWVLVVAAGSGQRMGADRPKQYLPIADRLLIEYTLELLCQLPECAGICLVLADGDALGRNLPVVRRHAIEVVSGGAERADSVLAGLDALSERAQEGDWVLVHDAARPCVRLEDIERLRTELVGSCAGGLLAMPVTDTIKQVSVDGQHCKKTVDRSGLWRALTPQFFPLRTLRQALVQAKEEQLNVTDEASAMELAGFAPRLISGASDNIKVTRPEDLPLAEFFLRQQGRII